jgi:hypothetical protein
MQREIERLTLEFDSFLRNGAQQQIPFGNDNKKGKRKEQKLKTKADPSTAAKDDSPKCDDLPPKEERLRRFV